MMDIIFSLLAFVVALFIAIIVTKPLIPLASRDILRRSPIRFAIVLILNIIICTVWMGEVVWIV